MHCKASKAPKTQTKYILGLNKDVSTEETMSYQTKLANQTCFFVFPALYVEFSHKMTYETFYVTNQIHADKV